MTVVAENQGKLNCFPLQFRHMSSEAKTVPGKKLKRIFKRVLDASEDNSCESTINILDFGSFERNVPLKESMPAKSKKRRLEISGPWEKNHKLESNLKLHLRKLLNELISHPAGPIFSEPVDPVKLKIPDYFFIVKKPMDLGTILRKLDGNMYSDAKEFAADVRLTFSNAMLYNPVWHDVHKWAKELDAKFNGRWKILGAKVGKVESGKQAVNGCSSLSKAVKNPSQSLTCPSGLGSDGGLISEADSVRLSTPASIEAPMSPKKALRAAMLKKRFADTIFKATHREHLDRSVQSDRLRLQQEREGLQQERREENAKLEALIKAAEEASHREQQHDLMMQRENERKAARIVFEKVEKSVEVDDNIGMLDNLKMIGCDYLYYPTRKDKYLEEDEDMAISDVEEGEILS